VSINSKKKIKTIGWGIIGSGGWADNTFAPAIKEARGAQLRAVLAPSHKEAMEFCQRHKIKKGYSKINDFLADQSIDVVWIAAPNYMHKDFTISALNAGKHVLCEKPMAITVKDCKAMIAKAKNTNLKLEIAYNNRHHPKLQDLRAAWVKGDFGRPVHGRAHLYYPYPDDLGYRERGNIDGWHSFDKRVGGWAYADCGTHCIDQLRWFLGDAKRVLASHNSNPSWGYRTPDHAVAMIEFKNGSVGTISASTGLTPYVPRLEFYGDMGYIIVNGGLFGEEGDLTTGIIGKKSTSAGNKIIKVIKKRNIKIRPINTYKLQVEAFVKSLTLGNKYPLSPEDGLENIKLISQARGW
tara:strand:- start:294 stop:1349 length:1056 start_codon:yes stop_codon:yes gene_type:complete